MKKALLLIISSLYFSYAVAQVTVEAAIDSIEMLIGEQVHVTVTATMKEGAKAEFPVFKPTQQLIPGVEVLKSTELGVKGKENGLVDRSSTTFSDGALNLIYIKRRIVLCHLLLQLISIGYCPGISRNKGNLRSIQQYECDC